MLVTSPALWSRRSEIVIAPVPETSRKRFRGFYSSLLRRIRLQIFYRNRDGTVARSMLANLETKELMNNSKGFRVGCLDQHSTTLRRLLECVTDISLEPPHRRYSVRHSVVHCHRV
jgi:hypothetical protein